MVVLFESAGVLRAIAAWKALRKAGTVSFCRRMHPLTGRRERWQGLREHLLRLLVWMINRQAKCQPVDGELVQQCLWTANAEALDVIDRLAREGTIPGAIAEAVFEDSRIVRYHQHFLARGIVSKRLAYFTIAKALRSAGKVVVLVPTATDDFRMEERFCDPGLRDTVPGAVRLINRAQACLNGVAWTVVLLVAPSLCMTRALLARGAAWGKREKRRGDVAVSVVWGLTDGQDPKHDGFLYNEKLGLRDVLYVFDRRRYQPGVREQTEALLAARGWPSVESLRLGLTFRVVAEMLRVQWHLFRRVGLVLGRRRPAVLQMIDVRAIYELMLALIDVEHFEAKVFVCRNDANSNHVIRTLVLGRRGLWSVGIHHTASPFEMPQCAYVCYDRYAVHGALYERLFAPRWRGVDLVRTGRMNIDWVTGWVRDGRSFTEMKERVEQKYGRREFNVVMLLPGAHLSRKTRWQAARDGLSAVRDLDLDMNLFLRVRPGATPGGNGAWIRAVAREDRRIIAGSEGEFATWELMALADMVIGCNASFGINEAFAATRAVFTFDYTGFAELYFADYGQDFVLRTKDDLVRTFKGLTTGFAGLDCEWDRLRADLDYHWDGGNTGRLQELVAGLLRLPPAKRVTGAGRGR